MTDNKVFGGRSFIDINTAAKTIFEILVYERNLQDQCIALCTCSGVVLTAFPVQSNEKEIFIDSISSLAESNEYLSSENKLTIVTNIFGTRLKEADDLCNVFTHIFSIYRHNEEVCMSILNGLDALPNSIFIYDKDVRLLYANSNACDYIHVKDRDKYLGRPIDDILRDTGIKFTSVKKPHDYLKVKDVMKYGKPVIDWEVEVTNLHDTNEYLIASNDMYPIFDSLGQVTGVAEISRSRNTKINQVRDTLGLTANYTFEDVVGKSKAMADVKKIAMAFAISPYNILIYGESGVGKELFAQSIHNFSIRRNKPFVAINCAGISPELIDSELFGYESGAFTGAAHNGRIGKFELSNGGTLFLDEVAELPLHAQTKLLRTLETGQIIRMGGTKNIPVDVRVIAATNRSLEDMISKGLFREDLYYRLMVLNLTIPPLRERPDDIVPCCEFFMKQATSVNNLGTKRIDESAKKLLSDYDWPGNVRELRNIINRVCIMSDKSTLTREDFISAFESSKIHFNSLSESRTPEKRLLDKQLEINHSYAALLKESLSLANGNKTEAAKLIGVSRKTFYNMLEKYKDFFD